MPYIHHLKEMVLRHFWITQRRGRFRSLGKTLLFAVSVGSGTLKSPLQKEGERLQMPGSEALDLHRQIGVVGLERGFSVIRFSLVVITTLQQRLQDGIHQEGVGRL